MKKLIWEHRFSESYKDYLEENLSDLVQEYCIQYDASDHSNRSEEFFNNSEDFRDWCFEWFEIYCEDHPKIWQPYLLKI